MRKEWGDVIAYHELITFSLSFILFCNNCPSLTGGCNQKNGFASDSIANDSIAKEGITNWSISS